MPSDIEIAHQTKLRPIVDVAAEVGLGPDDLEIYGQHKAKVTIDAMGRVKDSGNHGKMILVTAMTPTPAGEGKTTVSIGLSQALWKIGKKSVVALREPSLGPVFGLKGGATGGGHAQVLPMEDINLHFTGDIHAVTSAHNLLIAMLDNHLHQGNELQIDTRSINMKRALDLCDRSLRNVVVGIGGRVNGVTRESGFEITTASEVMSILALAWDLPDLKKRLGRIIVGETMSGRPVTAADLKAVGAMAATLKDAMKPNIVQTTEGTPALIHAGPFGNVSIGCNSVQATHLGLHLSDYLVTEAGFGSDLGAEKFLNIKCRAAEVMPEAVVVAGTIRAIKYQGGAELRTLKHVDMDALKKGVPNLLKHLENMQAYGLTPICALNRFETDADEEISYVGDAVKELGIETSDVQIWAKGGDGGTELAEMVVSATAKPSTGHFLYETDTPLTDKIEKISSAIYGADGVRYPASVQKKIKALEAQGFGRLPVCIAKTQNSLSDQATLRGRPEGFIITVNDLRVAAGAGFIIAYAGNIITMFGLPEVPAAETIDLSDDGVISGLF
jgi:formate--tetrahydrofolate ligase